MPEMDDDALPPRAGCWFLLLPILAAAAIVGGYGAVLLLGSQGRSADGALVRIAFEGCAEARPAVLERIAAMGLPQRGVEDAPGGFAATVQLPSDLAAAAEIPATLAATATFAIRLGEAPDGELLVASDGVASATLRLDFTVDAKAAIQLTPDAQQALEAAAAAHPGEVVTAWLDDTPMTRRKLSTTSAWDRLDLEPRTGDREASIRRAAEWALLVDQGPLPCPLTFRVEAL